MKIILASASPRRREILKHTGFDFEVMPADIEEKPTPGLTAAQTAEELSRQKAYAQRDKLSGDDVLMSADTVVELDGEILGKPHDSSDAVRMLTALSGRTHRVYTGVTLIKANSVKTFSVCTEVTFYTLAQAEIDEYISTGEPFDKAGAYGIQERGALLVKEIKGDYFNVMGLPIAEVAREIAKL